MLWLAVAAFMASLSIRSVSSTCARLDRPSCDREAGCVWEMNPEEGQQFCRCASKTDQQCVFAMDISGSIGSSNFEKEKVFVCDMIWDGLSRASTVGVLTFGSGAWIQWSFAMNRANNNLRKPVCDHVKAIRYTGGGTYMLTAVERGNEMFTENAQYDNKPRIFFLISDGNPNGGQNPCQNDQRAMDARNRLLGHFRAKVVFVGVGGYIRPSNVDCLWNDPSQVIMAASFDANDLDSIRFLTDSFLCPESFCAKLSEFRIAGGAGDGCVFVELWNCGQPWGLKPNPMILEGAVEGRLGGLDNKLDEEHWEPDKMLVLYHGRKCKNGAPRCESCNCRLGNLGADDRCDNALFVECNQRGAPCKFKTGYTKDNFRIKVIHANTGDVLVDYDETIDGCCADKHVKGYTCELNDPFNSDDNACLNWQSSCLPTGTPGAIPMRPNDNRAGSFPENCDALYECSKEHCRMDGDRQAACRGSPQACKCSDGYSEVCNMGAGIVKSCSCQ